MLQQSQKELNLIPISYNGSNKVTIKGSAFSDQDILKLISNLNNKRLISQASLASMSLPRGGQADQKMKGFTVACILENV